MLSGNSEGANICHISTIQRRLNIREARLSINLMVVRRAIAVVVSLALLQATAVAFACSINCSRVSSTKHVHGGTQQLAVHHHSHASHGSAASTCCPAAPQVTRSSCSSRPQVLALEVRYRINPDSLSAVENPICWVVRSKPSSPIFSSASPPNSLIRPALTTLRI